MSDLKPETFNAYARRCWIIFGVLVAATLLMVFASQAPIHNRHLAIALVLAGACFNAFLVAGYLMHLITERRTIYALLAFTTIFFVALLGLSVWSTSDLPELMPKIHH